MNPDLIKESVVPASANIETGKYQQVPIGCIAKPKMPSSAVRGWLSVVSHVS